VSTREGVKTASVELVNRNGVVYVPLGALVSQVGGGYKMSPDRVQIDLAEKSAWVRPNNTQVSASLGIFVLGAPVVQAGNDVLIAAGDVSVFFEKAFRLAAKQQGSAEPQAPAEPQTPEPPVEPEPQAIEPLEARQPDEAPAESLEPLVKQPAAETLPAKADETAVPADALPSANPTSKPSGGPAAAGRAVDRPVAVVIIDPGHGGADAGCPGASGIAESALAYAVAEKLRQAIEQGSSVKTILTRDKDRAASRAERVLMAHARKGDLLICLHAGAALSTAQQGCRLFVCGSGGEGAGAQYADRSRALAAAVAAGIAEATGRGSGGIYQSSCHVVREAAMPGLMIEIGMLTNPEEGRLLASEDYQAKLAGGIAAGIKKYMETNR
jgi:N-acetylmuramoyl-L-alanine amidase